MYDVSDIFKGLGYFESVAMFLANLCCYKTQLPQGAPTSPYLSNLRFRKIDDLISSYTKEFNIRYTRYADDMTFSGDFNPHRLIKKSVILYTAMVLTLIVRKLELRIKMPVKKLLEL